MTSARPRPPLIPGETRAYPVLPLRDIVVFPHTIAPLFVGRKKSILALEEAMRSDTFILLATQKNASDEDPATEAIYEVGTLASVLQLLKLPDGTVKILVEGAQRAKVVKYTDRSEYDEAEAVALGDTMGERVEAEAFARSVTTEFESYVKLNKRVPPEAVGVVQQIEDYAKLADTVASHLALKIPDRQAILETTAVTERLEKVLGLIDSEISVLQVEKRIRSRVKRQMEKTQREFFLHEQMKAIQKEIGDAEGKDDLAEIEDKIKKTKLSKEAREKATHELKKLRQMSPMSAESTVVRNYLDWLLSIPWAKRTKIKKDLKLAQEVLDNDHFGLDKVKERIVEYLAVQQRANKLTGPILCLVGPAGVGKTSLGKSIARATGRDFVRFSLGGVHDEAEIRGHRRTYIGSMPGKIIQSMRKAKTSNPLFLLDEVDKMGSDFRGDPSSALLEVLDSEQNNTFRDHYLDVPWDLSPVMFIATANTLQTIPPPLLDRMEVIQLSGYTMREKLEIAQRYLLPEQLKEHALTENDMRLTDDALRVAIEEYTREAGVRNLEREIANICRKVAVEVAKRPTTDDRTGTIYRAPTTENQEPPSSPIIVDADKARAYLGKQRYFAEVSERIDRPGIVTGLVWTPAGGDIIFIEATGMPGGKGFTLTGQLGDVMKESARAALSWVRAEAERLGIDPKFYETHDIHMHVPAGAIPKDGPSAGIAMTTALASLLTGRPVRDSLAMTGEITLRGKVLPIGGVKEKVLAAHRAGIHTVILPKRNEPDIDDIPEEVRRELVFIFADRMEEVLEAALRQRVADPPVAPATNGQEA